MSHSTKKSYELALSLVVLAAVSLVVFWEPIVSGTMPLHTDGRFMSYPAMAYFKRWALAGHFPVWWVTGSVAGNMADTAVSNPAWLLFMPLILLFQTETAWFLIFILTYLLAGLCMYAYLSRMTGHRIASLFGAILFMRSEWVTDCLVEPQIQLFLFPLVLLFFECLIETRRTRYLLLATASTALLFLGSHANYPIYLIPIATVYFFIRILQSNDESAGGRRQLFFYALTYIVTFLSVVWFRTYILGVVGLNSTRETLAETTPLFISPFSLLTVLFPDFLTHHSIQSPHIHDRLMQAIGVAMSGRKIRLHDFWYPGLFAAFFICCAWSARKITAWLLPHWITFLATLAYVLGGEVFILPLLRDIPLVNMLINTQRMTVLTTVTIPILAAAGMAAFMNSITVTSSPHTLAATWVRRFARFLLILLAFFLIKDLIVMAINSFALEALHEKTLGFIMTRGAYQQTESFYRERITDFLLWLETWANWRSPAIFVPLILYGAGTVLFVTFKKRKAPRLVLGIVFFGMVIWDGFVAHPLPFNTLVPRNTAYPVNPTIAFLKQDASYFRFLSLKPRDEVGFPWGHTQFLPADQQLVHGLSSVHGYQALTLRRYSDVFKLLAHNEAIDTIRLHDIYQYDDQLADLLNVKYVITTKPDILPGRTPVFEDTEFLVYQNRNALDRAFLVAESAVARDAAQSLAWLEDSSTDPREVAILEGKNAPAISSKALSAEDKVTIAEYTPHRVEVEVHTDDERILVLTDTYHPGWKSTLDGRDTPLYIAYHAFRAVRVPPGNHVVRFYLDPFPRVPYGAGLVVSACLFLWASKTTKRKKAGRKKIAA
ncbi:MAG: hypothetical protein Q8R76_05025 [Candidatus Omnitrophota bacterium]|nr:hypothetical protein [Candidatus Omnitrophota bacterium]